MRAARTKHGRYVAEAMELRSLISELRRLTRETVEEV